MTLGTLRSTDTSAAAYAQLRSLIVTGRLSPGVRLVETALADRLGTSRTPVRGALQRLQREGYLLDTEAVGRTQLIVAPLTLTDSRDLFCLLGELAALAAHKVACGAAEGRLRVAKSMLRTNEDLLTVSKAGPTNADLLFQLHTRFHRTYVEACGTPRVDAMHEVMMPQAERYQRTYDAELEVHLHASQTARKAIISAIAQGDSGTAELAVRVGWRNVAERVAGAIDRMGERGAW
jgi:DNA-binding GntR family transcriptional regulator